MSRMMAAEERPATAFTLVTEFFKCSAAKGRKQSIIPCSRDATMHITDAGDAPFCREHGELVLAKISKGEKVMTNVV